MSILIITVVLFALALFLPWYFGWFRTPRKDRPWRDGFRLANRARFEDNQVTIENVRDWRYEGKKIVSQDWRDITYDMDQIEDVWFMMEPFTQLTIVGHGFVLFSFKDGKRVVFSVEARMAKGQKFSAWDGIRNRFELSFCWGTAEDFLVRRPVYLGRDLRLHRLNISPESKLRLFQGFLMRTNQLYFRPKFYNTLTHNCTGELAKVSNQSRPGIVPWDKALFLTGKADKAIFKMGFFHSYSDDWDRHVKDADVADLLREHYPNGDWFAAITQQAGAYSKGTSSAT